MRAPSPRGLISGADLRRLLVLRAWLRDWIVEASRRTQRDVLRVLEQRRRERAHDRADAWTAPAMTPPELIRELKWRIDVAPLSDLIAVEAVAMRARREASMRARSGRQSSRPM